MIRTHPLSALSSRGDGAAPPAAPVLNSSKLPQTPQANLTKIQPNTNHHVISPEALAAWVGAAVEQALKRLSEYATGVGVQLGDKNAGRSGQRNQRCVPEARLEGRRPVAVTGQAATVERPSGHDGTSGAWRFTEAGAFAGQRMLWTRTSVSTKQLFADLPAWLAESQQSGIGALQAFGIRLRAVRV